MGRKKLKPQRFRGEPSSERSFYEHLVSSDHHTLDRLEMLNLIRGGEDTYLELKVRLTNSENIAAEIVALANSGGGAIIFGVNDNRRVEGLDDPEQVEEELRQICRTQIIPPVVPYIDKVAFDNGRRILVLEIEDRRAPHYCFDNRYYIREGATKREASGSEIADLFARLRPSGYESIPLFGADVVDLDESFVWTYIRELQGELFNRNGNYPTGPVLKDMQLAIDYADTIVPTVGGLLLFGKNSRIETLFFRSRVQAIRFSGETTNNPIIEKVEFCGNLATVFERSLAFISRYVDLWDTTVSRAARRQARDPINPRANFPRVAVLEALTNALVHRDYCAREQPVKLFIYDSRLEISNPCQTAGLPRKGIELYGLVTAPNPRLKAIFKSTAYGLNIVNGGIPMLRRTCYQFCEREPKISILQDEFKVELSGI
ncbi:MAG: RNA-binding domain-containing protein [Acidobacteriota bacterium]